MKRALVATFLLCFALPASQAQTSGISEAPAAIQELAASIQGKYPEEVHAAIVARFGAAKRDVGSGVRIEEWQVAGGLLEFHPNVGPTFLDAKTGQRFWLLRTSNPAAANILQSYEMVTLADPANHGSQFWLGNLTFGPESTYRFIDSGANLEHRAAQIDNFFMLHPDGTVEVRYVGSTKADTLLESLAEGSTVARLVFTSGAHSATFSVTSSARERRLAFKADEPLSFELHTGWKKYWPALRPKLVVLDVELTGDDGGPDFASEHQARLKLASTRLRESLARTGHYHLVDNAPAQKTIDELNARHRYLHDCNGCDLDLGRQLGADQVLVAWVDRVSALILSLTYEVHDVATGDIIARKSFGFRGDNDTSWTRAIEYMVRDLDESAPTPR